MEHGPLTQPEERQKEVKKPDAMCAEYWDECAYMCVQYMQALLPRTSVRYTTHTRRIAGDAPKVAAVSQRPVQQ